jgi:hypothetical protein
LGRYDEAVPDLEFGLGPRVDHSHLTARPESWLPLAVAKWHLGDHAGARECLSVAAGKLQDYRNWWPWEAFGLGPARGLIESEAGPEVAKR